MLLFQNIACGDIKKLEYQELKDHDEYFPMQMTGLGVNTNYIMENS